MTEPVRAIGIDFGTTSSKAAWYNPDLRQAQLLRNSESREETPSVIYYGPPPQEPVIGQVAAHLLGDGEDPARFVVAVKRDLADKRTYALPEDRYITAESIVATILAKVKSDAQEYHFQGLPVTHVVLTCPAEFDNDARKQLQAAAYSAGFEQVELLDEPVAAAIAYTHESQWSGKNLAVYDLGGGTFDVAVLTQGDNGTFTVVPSPRGLKQCGGEDFDGELFELCLELIREQYSPSFGQNDRETRTLHVRSRSYKEALSRKATHDIQVLLDPLGNARSVSARLERARFEQRIRPRIEQTVRMTNNLLKDCARRGVEVETLVLIGGSSAIPLVERLLRESLPPQIRIDRWGQSTQAVALGAAYKAAELWSAPLPPTPVHVDFARFIQVARIDLPTPGATSGAIGGGVIVARAKDGKIRRWSRQSRQLERTIDCPPALGDKSPRVAASRDSMTITASTGKHTIQIISLAEDPPISLVGLDGHKGPVTGLAFDSSQTQLLSGSEDGMVRVWSLSSGSSQTLVGPDGPIGAVAWSGDGSLIAAAKKGAMYIWRSDGQLLQPALVRPFSGTAIAWSPDGQWLAGAEDKTIALFLRVEGRGFAHLHTLAGHTKSIRDLSFSRDGRTLTSCSDDKTIRVWDVDTASQIRTLEGHLGVVTWLAFSPNGADLLSGSEDGTMRVWAEGRLVRARANLEQAGKNFVDACARNVVALKGDDLKDPHKLIACVSAATEEYVAAIEQVAREEAAELVPGFLAPTMAELDAQLTLSEGKGIGWANILGAVAAGLGLLISTNVLGRIIIALLAAGGVQRAAATVLARKNAEAQIRTAAVGYLPQLHGRVEQYFDELDQMMLAREQARSE